MAGKIFKFLPKAASFSIPNHNNNNNNNNNNKYMFSGPILPMIPDHCRRKSNEMLEEEEEELTSPKVSCMGQVRNHNKTNSNRKKKDMKTKTKKKASLAKKEGEQQQQKKKEAPNHTSSLGRLFWRKVTPARRGVDSSDDEVVVATEITRMRRYASGRRETLKDFDWRTITQNKAEEEEEEEEALVPHSAPILVIGGGDAAAALEPKKEINIWMRRARAPPIPLQLN